MVIDKLMQLYTVFQGKSTNLCKPCFNYTKVPTQLSIEFHLRSEMAKNLLQCKQLGVFTHIFQRFNASGQFHDFFAHGSRQITKGVELIPEFTQ